MAQKMKVQEKAAHRTGDDVHEDDSQWLEEMRSILSPYWSSRVEYSPEKEGHVLVIKGHGH